MSWAIGYDYTWRRDIGYGVPAICDHPDCKEEIDRGLAHVCAGEEPYGGVGCGLFFCGRHLSYLVDAEDEDHAIGCERCATGEDPFAPKPDVRQWVEWKLADESWKRWRDENPEEVAGLRLQLPQPGSQE